LDGVILTKLKRIYDSKGDVFHAMKEGDIGFSGFGEAYFSTVNQDCIKGWKKHLRMTLNLVVPVGKVEFVIYDENKKKFSNVKLSQENYQRLTIQPGLWIAFKGIEEYNILLNLANIRHDPDESVNIKINDILYEWKK
jgi:dTDP-4-dehydrorhamnose 3,5-epimerase